MNEGYWKYLRRLARGTEDAVLSAHIPACWWHPQGIRKMVKRLESRGFPWLRGWLFFTLTIDQKKFASETDAFEAGKDRLRRVIHELRKRGYEIKRHASKLELQGNGYPHWHLLVDSRDFIDEDLVTELWGLGFADVKRIKPTKWKYLFKYVVKGGGDVPDWVLAYPKRIRVFQTSPGFFSKPAPGGAAKADTEDSDDAAKPKPETLASSVAGTVSGSGQWPTVTIPILGTIEFSPYNLPWLIPVLNSAREIVLWLMVFGFVYHGIRRANEYEMQLVTVTPPPTTVTAAELVPAAGQLLAWLKGTLTALGIVTACIVAYGAAILLLNTQIMAIVGYGWKVVTSGGNVLSNALGSAASNPFWKLAQEFFPLNAFFQLMGADLVLTFSMGKIFILASGVVRAIRA